MNRNRSVSWLVAGTCTLALVVLGSCARSTASVAALSPSVMDQQTRLSNHLYKAWCFLRDAKGEGDTFPRSFAELRPNPSQLSLFLCPNSGQSPGSATNIEEWAEFVYVGNNTDQVPRATLMISPPENHHGECGYVVCVDGFIREFPPKFVRELIQQPWKTASNSPPDNLNYMRQRVTVCIPKKWRAAYPSVVSPQ
jgi:hypothetical protein